MFVVVVVERGRCFLAGGYCWGKGIWEFGGGWRAEKESPENIAGVQRQ